MLFKVLATLAALVTGVAAAWAQGGALSVPIRAADSPTASVESEVVLYRASHALVIGIDAYAGGWPVLSNAVRDARLVADELRRHGFTVTLRTDLRSADLEQAFTEFFVLQGGDPDARLFAWFSGHAHTAGGEGFLVPADAPRAETGAPFRYSALSLYRLAEYVRLARARHVYAAFDACFSGSLFAMQREAPPRALTRVVREPVRQFLAACEDGQAVRDDGAFREAFLRALRGAENADANRDGFVTASEIGLYLGGLAGAQQAPRYGKLEDRELSRGEFVFKALPLLSVAAPPATAPADSVPAETSAAPEPAAPPQAAAVPAPPPDPKPGESIRDCDVCPEMVVVPAGSFMMGSPAGETDREGVPPRLAARERPQHPVTIARPFAVSKLEVTREQFQRYVSETGAKSADKCLAWTGREWRQRPGRSWRDPGFPQTPGDPVACVSRDEAKYFAAWLSRRTGKAYRLLSEAEWEYAARAGTTTARHWGEEIGDGNANCDGCGAGRDKRQTLPAGSFPANAFGLHDMLGNVAEWVEDCWNDGHAGAPSDGAARTGGDCRRHVIRGGAWLNLPRNVRAADRGRSGDDRSQSIGFRVARTL